MNKAAYMLGYNHRSKMEKVAKVPGSWELHSKMFGNSAPGTLANIGTYFIPGYGDARMGYDALGSYANMLGKGLTWKQRLGHGLVGTAEGLVAATGLAAGAVTSPQGGWGSSLVSMIGKPTVMALSKFTKGRQVLKAISKVKGAHKLVGKQIHRIGTTKMGPAGKYMFNPNPYAKLPGALNKAKYVGHGAGRLLPPVAMGMYGDSMIDPEQKQAMEKDAVSSKYISKRIRGATLKEMLAVLGLPLKIKAAQKYNSKFDRVFQRLEDARNLERFGVK